MLESQRIGKNNNKQTKTKTKTHHLDTHTDTPARAPLRVQLKLPIATTEMPIGKAIDKPRTQLANTQAYKQQERMTEFNLGG